MDNAVLGRQGSLGRAHEARSDAVPETPSKPQPMVSPPARRGILPNFRLPDLVFLLGLAAVVLPTMIFVASETWSGEEGAHAPIVLMTGIWLVWAKWPSVRQYVSTPPAWLSGSAIAVMLALFVFTRITQIVEVEGFVMYGAALACVFALVGGKVMRLLAFPLIYLAFVFPLPETIIYAITMPLKIAISESAIALLKALGYPIGGTGVTIQIGQYQLLVAAACSGLNSIVSLSALTTFYIYVRHSDNLRYAAILLLAVLPVAIAANFFRVLILILLTYHAGEATAQGFMHDLAGIFMFANALLLIFLLDMVLQKIGARRKRDAAAQGATA